MQQSTVRILMADDDPEDLEIISEAILDIEPTAELQKFTSGKLVIDYLSSRSEHDLPCLIILDYNMPEINGAQVLSFMQSEVRYNPIPKVMLSTSNAPRHMTESYANGAAGYYVKPDNMREMNNLAQKLVAYCKPSRA